MANQKFQPGDVVILKSGSPKMTVQFSSDDGWTYVVMYNFNTFELHTQLRLPTAALKLAE